MDTRLRDGHSLLFHDLVNRDTINVRHLIELVNAHDTAIREDHRPCFQPPLARVLVRRHSSRQTNAWAAPARRRDRQWGGVQDEPQDLGLGRWRVANHEHVNVSSDVGSIWQVFLCSTQQQENNRFFDLLVSVDRGCKGLWKEVEDVRTLGELVYRTDVWVCERCLCNATPALGRQKVDVIRENERPIHARN
jgi:hypothetical protein